MDSLVGIIIIDAYEIKIDWGCKACSVCHQYIKDNSLHESAGRQVYVMNISKGIYTKEWQKMVPKFWVLIWWFKVFQKTTCSLQEDTRTNVLNKQCVNINILSRTVTKLTIKQSTTIKPRGPWATSFTRVTMTLFLFSCFDFPPIFILWKLLTPKLWPQPSPKGSQHNRTSEQF